MHLDHFRSYLTRSAQTAGFEFELAGPASEAALLKAEEEIGEPLPHQAKLFFRAHNGLRVPRPHLVILPVEQLVRRKEHVHFATLGEGHLLGFDVSALNAAEQWNIVSLDTGAVVTRTMASFWSNKIWAWLMKGREIWRPDAPHTS